MSNAPAYAGAFPDLYMASAGNRAQPMDYFAFSAGYIEASRLLIDAHNRIVISSAKIPDVLYEPYKKNIQAVNFVYDQHVALAPGYWNFGQGLENLIKGCLTALDVDWKDAKDKIPAPYELLKSHVHRQGILDGWSEEDTPRDRTFSQKLLVRRILDNENRFDEWVCLDDEFRSAYAGNVPPTPDLSREYGRYPEKKNRQRLPGFMNFGSFMENSEVVRAWSERYLRATNDVLEVIPVLYSCSVNGFTN